MRHLFRAPNYDLLSNIVICNKLVYVTMDLRDDNEEQETSDLVAQILFMGEERLNMQKELDIS